MSGDKLVASIGSLAKGKHELVRSYFATESLFGVPASDVIMGFDSADASFQSALNEDGSAKSGSDVSYSLDQAKGYMDDLKSEFAKAGSAPPALQTGFVALDAKATTTAYQAHAGLLKGGDLATAVRALIDQEAKLISLMFRGESLFGVRSSEVIAGFVLIDRHLTSAEQEAPSGGPAIRSLKEAEGLKQLLEDDFAMVTKVH